MKTALSFLTGIIAASIIVYCGGLSHADDIPAATTGSVTGHATDKDGQPLPKLSVKIAPAPKPPQQTSQQHRPNLADPGEGQPKPSTKPTPSGKIQTVTTDSDGAFTFENVPPGQYVVTATSTKAGQGKAEVHVDA